MKDFLDQEYGPGDKVLYAAGSGRSITMVLAEVIEIYRTYEDQHIDRKIRLKDGEQAPFWQRWDHDTRGYVDTDERVETEIRVKVQPLSSSRWTQHHGHQYYVDTRSGKQINPYAGGQFRNPDIWAKFGGYRNEAGELVDDQDRRSWDQKLHYEAGELQSYIEERVDEVKPVTLTVTDNIVLWRRKNREDHPEWRACRNV